MKLTSSQLSDVDRAEIAERGLNCLEAGGVERFHAEPQVRCQTVGLHTYGVCAILIAMGCLLEPEDRWLMGAAILHDAPERWTGDMPFPVKRSSAAIKTMMDTMDTAVSMDKLFPITRLSHRQETLLKLADMLEGLHWCLSGNEHRGRARIEVSEVWDKAIKDLLVEKHGELAEGEPERFWQLYVKVALLQYPPLAPSWPNKSMPYDTFNAYLEIHGKQQ